MPLPLAVPDVDVLKISNDDAAFILGKNGKTSASPPSPPRSAMSQAYMLWPLHAYRINPRVIPCAL